jgi:Spy/CpxP family protein refolding chaperone
MLRFGWRSLAVAMAVLWLGLPEAQAGEQRKRWWHDEKMKAELGLTEQQSADVHAVFQAALPRLRAAKKELDELDGVLSAMIRERTADESEVARVVDKVEAARSSLGKERTLMLYRIHRILTPEQNARLKALHDQQERARDGRPRTP